MMGGWVGVSDGEDVEWGEKVVGGGYGWILRGVRGVVRFGVEECVCGCGCGIVECVDDGELCGEKIWGVGGYVGIYCEKVVFRFGIREVWF